MSAAVRFGAVALDCADPQQLAEFYRDLLDGEITWASDGFNAVRAPGILLTMHRIDGYQPPTWPENSLGKQLHIDFGVDELGAPEARAIALGAKLADVQPAPEKWRVLLDPAGHPFCITALIPEA